MELRGLLWRKLQEMSSRKRQSKGEMSIPTQKIEDTVRPEKIIEKSVNEQTDYLMNELKSVQKEMNGYKHDTKLKLALSDKNLSVSNKLMQKIVKQNDEIIALLKKKRSVVVQI